jgi:hypothetical protein
MAPGGADRRKEDEPEGTERFDAPSANYLGRDPAGRRDALPDDVSGVAADGAAYPEAEGATAVGGTNVLPTGRPFSSSCRP